MSVISKLTMLGAAGAGGGLNSYWIATVGGAENDQFDAVCVDSAGNIIAAGFERSVSVTNYNGLIVKFDPDGAIIWIRNLVGTPSEYFHGVTVDSSDNVIAVGKSSNPNDAIIAKYNSSGTLLWQRKLTGTTTSTDEFKSVSVDSNDNILVFGQNNTWGAGGLDFWITKYNSSGVLQYTKSLGTNYNDYIGGGGVDANDNAYIVGQNEAFSGGNFIFSKITSAGSLSWARSATSSGTFEFAYNAAVNSSGDIVGVGTTTYVGGGGRDCCIVKYNTSGSLQWQKSLGISVDDYAFGVCFDSSNSVIVTGISYTGYKLIVAKYNSSGTLQFSNVLDGYTIIAGNSVTVDAADNIIIAGRVNAVYGKDDALVIKLPGDGSGTGTWGSFTYQSATFTQGTPSFTSTSVSMTLQNTQSLTDATTSYTSATPSLSYGFTQITP